MDQIDDKIHQQAASHQSQTLERIEKDPIGTDAPVRLERCEGPIGICHLPTILCHTIHRRQGESIPEIEEHKQLNPDSLPSY